MQAELLDSTLFESVKYADNKTAYQILISTAVYNHEGGGELGAAALAGATLFLTPMINAVQIKVRAALTWHGLLIKSYQYEIPFTAKATLFTLNQDTERDMAKSVISHIINDFQQNDIFSAEVLNQTLRASNYTTDLYLPETVGDLIRDTPHIIHHPFQGVQVRYIHNQFQFDYIDIFVYPIRNWQWQDLAETLEQESFRIRKDLELVAKENHWSSLNMGPDIHENQEVNSNRLPTLNFVGTYSDAESQKYETQTYLFIQEDKFVKIRSTFPYSDRPPLSVQSFAQQIIADIKVPDESLFMAKVRKRWRDNSQNQ